MINYASERYFGAHPATLWVCAVVASLAALLLPGRPALALINPNFTPVDMVRATDRIVVLEVTAPTEEGRMTARVLRTLKGEALALRAIQIDSTQGEDMRPNEVVAAFAGRDRVPAIFLEHEEPGWEQPDGILRLDTTWFAVRFGDDGVWHLDRDDQDVEAVWAGGARQLERAVRYVLEDRGAAFPVAARMRWEAIESMGQLDGPATGMLRADLAGTIGPVAMVLSAGGDRLYQVQGDGRAPQDITGQSKLATASRRAVVGDFTGNGRLDVASWNGRELVLAIHGEEGHFTTRSVGVPLADCRSLAAVDVGGRRGSGLLVGRGDGPPLLLIPEGEGFASRPLTASGSDLGTGGVSLAADLDGNGRWDVVEVLARGLILYRGRDEPGTFHEPVTIPMRLVQNPTGVLAADFDIDGRLDLMIAGDGGLVLLRQEEGLRWEDATQITGELWRHANVGDEGIADIAPADINADSRPGVVLMMPGANPMVFFNRGFAVFGLAMNLVLAESNLEGAADLSRGQSAGLMADLTGNSAQDLMTVDLEHRIWLAKGRMIEGSGLWLTLSLPQGAVGPRTVTVTVRDRVEGIHVIRPGVPALIGCRNRGPVDLTWTEPDGSRKTQRIVVIQPTNARLAP
ncbi:MAG: VCBS repeat-containing protein [Phycisphaeraceae bacterium]|nr:VCBS repeat-containing protein [Phycisphaeraceae bacterium]